jgi:hypothetical protein
MSEHEDGGRHSGSSTQRHDVSNRPQGQVVRTTLHPRHGVRHLGVGCTPAKMPVPIERREQKERGRECDLGETGQDASLAHGCSAAP